MASAEGLAVELSGWRYPVVCEIATGTLKYDNYRGTWGEQEQLDRFMQAYACEKAKLEARRAGHIVTEHPLAVRMYLARIGDDRNARFGHDLYLTRERHGAGYWDRGLGELGDYLTDIAHAYGAAETLFDTDGTVS